MRTVVVAVDVLCRSFKCENYDYFYISFSLLREI